MESQPVSPEPTPTPSSAPAPAGNEGTYAAVSLMTGVVSLCAWLLPLCGGPLSIAAIVLGYLALKDPSRKTLAIAGMAMGVIGIIATCINGAVGAYMSLTGQTFNFAP